MPITLEEMAKTKKPLTLDEMAGEVAILPARENPFGEFAVPPKRTFGQKWKEYLFDTGYEGRWTKPGRYEKFYTITKWPAKTALKCVGSVINRMNKFVTEISPVPEVMKTTATLDPDALKDIMPSMWASRKALDPTPGGAKELRTFGEATAEDWYEPLAREKPPWWYTPAMDAAFETLLLSGAAAQRASRVSHSTFSNAKLVRSEIKAAKRIYSTKALAKMQPAQVRATLAKESAIIVLSKAEKAQLLRRGYKPIQIQNMTPLDAYQVMDDIPMAESAYGIAAKELSLPIPAQHKGAFAFWERLHRRRLPGQGALSQEEEIIVQQIRDTSAKFQKAQRDFLATAIETPARKKAAAKFGKLIRDIDIQVSQMPIKEVRKRLPVSIRKPVQVPESRMLASATRVAIDRLTAGIKRAKRLHPQKERMISLEKSRRVAVAQKILSDQTGEKAFLAARGPLKGEYSVPAFTAPEILPADRYYLFESLRTPKMPFFRKLNTSEALLKLLRGDMPTRAETALLQRHFGSGLAKAILQKRAFGTKAWQGTLDILNIPRATLASWDLSFPLRQGIMLLPGHPKQWVKSFGQMMKAARPGHKGKDYARYLEDMAESSRYAGLRHRAKLEITQWGLADITAREEPFLSSWAELIPGVKWSERTFTTMSNQLRINVFDDIARNWEKAGMSWTSHPEAYTRLAAFLNHATGRGTIPERYVGITPHLNALFFSPRYQLSRPQVVYDAFVSMKNPAARKVIVGDLVKFVGTGTTSMWLLNQIEGVDVELDPRSSDFGKVKYGNTRYDFWAGYSQIARLIAQVSAGQAMPKGGELYNINRADTIERYIRTKLSPPAGFAWDVLEGQTFLGEEMVFEPTFIGKEALKRTVPMVAQDIIEAVRYQGLDGALPITSITAFFGLGVGTWEPSKWELLSREQDHLANATYGKEWDKLNEVQQDVLKRDNKLLDNLKREAQYERTVFPFLEEIKKEQLVAGLDVEMGLNKKTQKEMEQLKIRVGSLPRSFGDWTLNDERYEKYKTYITEELKKQLSPVMEEAEWETKSDERKRSFIEKAIEVAKKRARTSIRIEARK